VEAVYETQPGNFNQGVVAMRTSAFSMGLLLTGLYWFVGLADAVADGPIMEFELTTPANHMQAIVVGPDGNVWATACAKPKIIRVTPDGKVTEFPVPGPNVKLLQGITVGTDGNLWFTSSSDNTIRRISPKGEFNGEFRIPTTSGKVGSNTSFPRGIATGPDGNVWFAELGGNKIGRITPKGEITEFPIPTPDSGPYQPAFDRTGKVWFCESTANKIGRLDPTTGKVDEFPLATKVVCRET
jgi:virginiamycin B lyase